MRDCIGDYCRGYEGELLGLMQKFEQLPQYRIRYLQTLFKSGRLPLYFISDE